MKDAVAVFAIDQYKRTVSNHQFTYQQQLYRFSMSLLALATVMEFNDYRTILNTMESILYGNLKLSEIEKPWQLWMLGAELVLTVCMI